MKVSGVGERTNDEQRNGAGEPEQKRRHAAEAGQPSPAGPSLMCGF